MNCEGTIICIFFSKDTYFSTVIHDLQFVESWNAEPQIWRANHKVIQGFLTAQGASVPNLYVFKGSNVMTLGDYDISM